MDYDLLSATGHGLRDIGGALGWDSVRAVVSYPRPDSALMREVSPEVWSWSSATKTNTILADIWDMLAQINANLVAIGSRKPARKIRPYPRPKQKGPEDETKIGSGALPPEDLAAWFEEKRREKCQK